jgi:hypothetical protein
LHWVFALWRGEKRKKENIGKIKWKKRKKDCSLTDEAAICWSTVLGLLGLLGAIKSYFEGQLLYTMCTLCIAEILLSEKVKLPHPYNHKSEVFFHIHESTEIHSLPAIIISLVFHVDSSYGSLKY